MAKVRFIDKVKDELLKTGFSQRTKEARNWLFNKVKTVRWNEGAKLGFINLGKNSRSKTSLDLGKMYFYTYDPKTKEKLPYYDTFPLVFPIDYMPPEKSETKRDAGFLGINLHYIPPKYRIYLLDKLYTIATDDRFDERTKIMLSYRELKARKAFFSEAMPCLKWYLFKYLKSNILEIHPEEWEILAFLPFEDFKKVKYKSVVWTDSRNKMRGY